MAAKNEMESDEDVKEFQSLLHDFKETIKSTKSLAFLSLIIFGIASLFLFLLTDLGPLHRYWDPLGKIADIAWMASILFAIYGVGMWWSAGKAHRDAKRDYDELLEDRYGVK